MEPARWSQLSDGESFMVLRTQQLHRARLRGSALLSIFLVGSRCRPSCVYPGFVFSCSPAPLSTSSSFSLSRHFLVPMLLLYFTWPKLFQLMCLCLNHILWGWFLQKKVWTDSKLYLKLPSFLKIMQTIWSVLYCPIYSDVQWYQMYGNILCDMLCSGGEVKCNCNVI